MAIKVFVTGVLWIAYLVFNSFWSRVLTQLQGIEAARVVNDDSVTGNALSQMFRQGDWVGAVVLVVVVCLTIAIWYKQLSSAFKSMASSSLPMMLVSLAVIFSLTACGTARATNESERRASEDTVTVEPNESAFVIPAQGGNLSGQVQFDSTEYLEQKKVASKRITIQKENIGERYLPKVFVILVNRTPYARQWTKSADTGTSAANQAICAEGSESLEICFQLAIAANIRDSDASAYLFNYPSVRVDDKQVSGVFKAAPLSEIVDNQIRQYIQASIGQELVSRSILEVIADKQKIISTVEDATKKRFKAQGITIEYVGLGGQLVYDDSIQNILNQRFIAAQNIELAKARATVVAIEADAARNAAIIRANGDAESLAKLNAAVGGDPAKLAAALEAYRWNGSRVTVMLAPEGGTQVSVPLPTATPTK